MKTTESAAAKKAFRLAFNGEKNFVSPDQLWIGVSGNYAVEISKSDHLFESIFGHTLYGVTVLDMDGSRTKLSKSFGSYSDAMNYQQSLDDSTQ